MSTTYVCGHRNPDTDAIVSAMSYASLRSALGDNDYVAARLGGLNDESSFLLERFGFAPPMLLTTVRTQVKDLDFDRPPMLSANVPISYAWECLQGASGFKSLLITKEDGSLSGLVTASSIAERDMETIQNPTLEETPVYNVLSALEGHILNSDDNIFDSIAGEVSIALPASGDENVSFGPSSIVLCGQQEEVAEKALAAGAACLIFCQCDLAEKYRGTDSQTCLIFTPYDAWRAARRLYQAVPVSRVATADGLVCFHLDDFLDDVRDVIYQSRYRSYPILDKDGKAVGTLSRYHLVRPMRKRVVLVDHNEMSQSVPGLEQAELIGIVDHHRLGDVQTGYPVFMRNEPVGSTNTIIATMFQENGILPGKQLAGLMAAAIVSDTVMFKSPTATPRDRRIAERLARIAGLDLEELGKEVFSAGSADKPARALLTTDYKEFHIADHSLAISQITTMDSGALLAREEEFLSVMDDIKQEKHYDMILLMITDVLKEGSELLFVGDGDIISQAFNVDLARQNHVFLKGVMSRKKQVVPALALLWG